MTKKPHLSLSSLSFHFFSLGKGVTPALVDLPYPISSKSMSNNYIKLPDLYYEVGPL